MLQNLKADTEIVVGEAIRIGDRSIRPVVRASAIYTSEGVMATALISPLALVVTEPTMEYCLDLTDLGLTLDLLMEMSPDLREMINQSRRERCL